MKLLPIAVFSLSCLGAAQSAFAADTLEKINASNTMTLAYRESSVPFSYLLGMDNPVGFSVDLAKAISEEVKKKLNKPNLQIKWQGVTSQNRVPLIANGTVDLECGSTTNNSSRAKDVTFAINHFYTGTRLLVRKDSGIKGYADLKDKTIVSTSGATNVMVMRKYAQEKNLNMELITAKDHTESVLLVETGRAVAFALDDVVLYGLKGNAKSPELLEVVGEAMQVEPYACMLHKDDPKFKALVDDAIRGLMKSGEFEKMYAKWFLSPIPPRNQTLNIPMGPELRENLKAFSDKPAT